jgi:hypothetical protein
MRQGQRQKDKRHLLAAYLRHHELVHESPSSSYRIPRRINPRDLFQGVSHLRPALLRIYTNNEILG